MNNFDNKKVFAENLNYYMRRNKINRNKICSDLGFNYTTVREWTNGTAYPRIDKIESLATYFGISKSDLIESKQQNDSSNEDNETIQLEKILRENGLLDENDIFTDEQYNRVMEFIKVNQKFLFDDKKKKGED